MHTDNSLLINMSLKLSACLKNSALRPLSILTFNLSQSAEDAIKDRYPNAEIQNLKTINDTIPQEKIDLIIANIAIADELKPEALFYAAKRSLSKTGFLLFGVFDRASHWLIEKQIPDCPIVYESDFIKGIDFFKWASIKESVFEDPKTHAVIYCDIFLAARADLPVLKDNLLSMLHGSEQALDFLNVENETEALEGVEPKEEDELEEAPEQEEAEEFEKAEESEKDEALEENEEQEETETAEELDELEETDEQDEDKEIEENDEEDEEEDEDEEQEEQSEDKKQEELKETYEPFEEGLREKAHEVMEFLEHHKEMLDEHQEKITEKLNSSAQILNQFMGSQLTEQQKKDKLLELQKAYAEHFELLKQYNVLKDTHQQLLNQCTEHAFINDTYHKLVQHHQEMLAQHDENIQEHLKFLNNAAAVLRPR